MEIPRMTIGYRFAAYFRQTEDESDIKDWSFDRVYQTFCNLNYFSTLKSMGQLNVSYNGVDYIKYIPDSEYENRHQCIALAMFIDCVFKPKALISCHHEVNGEFAAIFEQVSNVEYKYTTNTGLIVTFKFDITKPTVF